MAAAFSGVVCLSANVANPAVASGETRTLNFYNPHTDEGAAFTYLVNGAYDPDVLDKINWFMRDWRINESIKMDPKLFDIIWQVYQEAGCSQPIEVLSAYRSPQTNAMLRMRSRRVAEHSQHMQGKAIDAHFQDITVAKARDIAMHMQAGGVGFYPVGGTPWVHIDSGSVRYWPRMNRDALARIFPDGKTVFIPSDGQPMPGFEEARAEIEARGNSFQTASNSGQFNLFTWLFSNHAGGADDAEESGPESVVTAAKDAATPAAAQPVAQGAVVASVDPSAKSDATVDAVDAVVAAPLPPRRPRDLVFALAGSPAPLPPNRPHDVVLALATDDSSSHQDLIRALLEKGGLPNVITRGIVLPPKRALALAEAPARDNADTAAKLAKAAALIAPMPKETPRKPTLLDTNATASISASGKARPFGPVALLAPAPEGADDSAFGALPLVSFASAAPSAAEGELAAALKNAAR